MTGVFLSGHAYLVQMTSKLEAALGVYSRGPCLCSLLAPAWAGGDALVQERLGVSGGALGSLSFSIADHS